MSYHGDPPSPTVLLLTHARTASHVIQRMLSKQPNIVSGEDWFHTDESRLPRRAVFSGGPLDTMDRAIPQELMTIMDKGYIEFRQFLDDANQQGKTAFAYTQPHAMLSPKLMSDLIHHGLESVRDGDPGPWLVTSASASELHTNPTVLPDAILLRPGTVPIINFRHPLLVCEGVFRGLRDLPAYRDNPVNDKVLLLGSQQYQQRLMYEWYLKHGKPVGIEPILVDADDYLGPEKELLMQKICDRIPGFDINKVIYSWPRATPEEVAALPAFKSQAFKTILGSDGVLSGYDMANRNIDTEMIKWIDKWGQRDANTIRRLIDMAMPDYEFLRAHRLKPTDLS